MGTFLKFFLGLIILSTLSACGFRADLKSGGPTLHDNPESPSSPSIPGEPTSNPSTEGSPSGGSSVEPGSSSSTSPATPSAPEVEVIPPGSEPNSQPSTAHPLDIQCIESLCGENQPLPHPFEINGQSKEQSETVIATQIKKPLQNYMGRIIHKALLQDEMFKKLFESDVQIQLTPEKAALILSIRYLNNLNKYMSAVERDPQGLLKFNLDKLRNLVGSGAGKEDEVQAIVSLTNLLNFIVRTGPIFDYHLELLLKIFYSNLSSTDALKQEASIMQIIRNYIGALSPSLNFVKPSDLVIGRALRGENLSYTEKLIFKSEMKNRYIMGHLLIPEVQDAFKKVRLDIPAVMAEAKQAYLASKPAAAVADPKSIKGLLQTAVQTCSAKLSYSYAALPSQNQMDTFNRIFDSMQVAAQAMVEQKSHSTLSQPLKIQLLTPPTKDEALISWAASLKDAVEISDASLKEIKKIDLTKAETLGELFIWAALFRDEEMFSTIYGFCDQAKMPFLDDAALRGMFLINISWPTIVYPRMGIGIIAHEVGHIVSGQWNTLVQPEQNCLKQKQGTDLYVEEDFADLFSSELVRRSGFQVGGTNAGHYACSLHQMTSSGWARGNLLAFPNDPHSSGFFRIIATAEMMGHQTSQCRSYLQSVGETRFQNYCRWQ